MTIISDKAFKYKDNEHYDYVRCSLKMIPRVLDDELKTINDETLEIKYNQTRFIISAIMFFIDEYNKRNKDIEVKQNEISI